MKRSTKPSAFERIDQYDLQALVQAQANLEQAMREPMAARNAVLGLIAARYSIKLGIDQIDLGTGAITRGKSNAGMADA